MAAVIGMLTASFPGVKYGPLHFRTLEKCKDTALKVNKGNYNALMSLDSNSKHELGWWISNIKYAYNDI